MNNTNLKYINETWLSNQLAWLLDPNGSHGHGSEFADDFFPKVLKKKKLKGNENFSTFEVCREFYLQVNALDKKYKDESPRWIDIVFMDLFQNIIIVIENKYDGRNAQNQLSEYMQIEELFPNCEIYYIYLDYYGKGIVFDDKVFDEEKVFENYNEISWTNQVLEILENMAISNYEIFRLYKILKMDPKIEVDLDQNILLDISIEILNKYNESLEKKSEWIRKDSNTISNGWNYPIDIDIINKNIQIIYGHKRQDKVQISNKLSNSQVLMYLVNILKVVFVDARPNATGINLLKRENEIFTYIKKDKRFKDNF